MPTIHQTVLLVFALLVLQVQEHAQLSNVPLVLQEH